jgi:hypothetical protein
VNTTTQVPTLSLKEHVRVARLSQSPRRALSPDVGRRFRIARSLVFTRLTAVQQKVEHYPTSLTEGVGRIGISVGIDVQVPLGRDPNRRMAEPSANDF